MRLNADPTIPFPPVTNIFIDKPYLRCNRFTRYSYIKKNGTIVKYNIKDYDHIVPIGSNCRIGQALEDLGYRKFSLPLDWTLTSCEAIYRAFEKDFADFMSLRTCVVQNVNNYPHVLNTEFNVNITHDKVISEKSIEKYERRSRRLLQILSSDAKVLFIRHHNDGEYMVNDIIHSDYNAREVKNGHDPLDLSYLYKLHDLISQKYPELDFDIILFLKQLVKFNK